MSRKMFTSHHGVTRLSRALARRSPESGSLSGYIFPHMFIHSDWLDLIQEFFELVYYDKK